MTRMEDFDNKIIRKNSLDLIEKMIAFGNEDLNFEIRESFQSFVNNNKRTSNKKFDELFAVLGGPLIEFNSEPNPETHSFDEYTNKKSI